MLIRQIKNITRNMTQPAVSKYHVAAGHVFNEDLLFSAAKEKTQAGVITLLCGFAFLMLGIAGMYLSILDIEAFRTINISHPNVSLETLIHSLRNGFLVALPFTAGCMVVKFANQVRDKAKDHVLPASPEQKQTVNEISSKHDIVAAYVAKISEQERETTAAEAKAIISFHEEAVR